MKLFISDYDMTIYINRHIDKNVFDAIKKWREKRNVFVIATGRNKFSIFEHIDRNNLEFDYVIANNGAVILNSNREVIFENAICDSIAYDVIRFIYKEFDNGTIELVSNNITASVKSKNNYDNPPFEVDKKISIEEIENINNIIQINKTALCDKDTQKIADTINKNFKEVIAYPNIRTVDIVKSDVNKANGIKFLEEIFNNNLEKILVAGDSNNDIEMIKKYNGYVQVNAREDIKSITNKYFNIISDIIYEEM